ncbi:sigma-70 family RNA polymerase sigma factor [Paenarthrobacter nitroguajacolicus]|uniref:sigma-70 family RNA polymerase sigma factor n=1 Tax=Paenarthrobacter nitroguajacolicus TaxID=211146 RepID=UPI003AE713F8
MSAANPVYPDSASENESCATPWKVASTGQGSRVHASTPRTGVDPPPGQRDESLLSLIRGGDVSAFDELFKKYRNLAAYVARVESDNASDVEDVVGEAFAAVFRALLIGRGPAESFRAYLLTTVRRMAHRRNVQARRARFLSDVPKDCEASYDDPSLDALEPSSLTQAFRSLPMRWQAVLWYSEVEVMKPGAIAPLMGLTPNGVSALLIRARKGLRRAYLQDHVPVTPMDSCVEVSQQLGKFVLGTGRAAGHDKIRRHVQECPDCAVALATLREMRRAMKGAGEGIG